MIVSTYDVYYPSLMRTILLSYRLAIQLAGISKITTRSGYNNSKSVSTCCVFRSVISRCVSKSDEHLNSHLISTKLFLQFTCH